MKSLKILVLALLVSAVPAFAIEEGHIISGSSNSSVEFEKVYGSYDATFGLALGYDYAFKGGLQVGTLVGAAIFSGGSFLTLAAGPTYNFNADIENSFFAGAKVGFITAHFDAASSVTDTFMTADIGKRFKLMENVSYTPGVTVTKMLEENSADPSFSINLFRLSIIF